MSTAPILVAAIPPEELEATSAMLFDNGASAVTEQPQGARVQLIAGFSEVEHARRALTLLPPGTDAHVAEIEADEWITTQRPAITVVRAGEFEVHPPWRHAPSSPIGHTIVIDPAGAFGHGGHPSTLLVLELLPTVVAAGDRVLDVGTGTGILAIAAARLGAGVRAIDVDPLAVETAHANVQRNGVDDLVDVELVDESVDSHHDADVALVNLTLAGHRRVARQLDSIDVIAVSGILDEQVVEAETLYGPRTGASAGSTHGWTALVMRRDSRV